MRPTRPGAYSFRPVRGKPYRIATPAAAAKLIAALPVADRAVWGTAFYAGLRLGELRALRWKDVNIAAGKLHVPGTGTHTKAK